MTQSNLRAEAEPLLRPSSESRPLISVIIAAYNYACYLEQCVLSVLEQASPNMELLVIDDGSTDDTPQLLDRLHTESSRPFRSIRKPNGGLASVRNLGIDESSGEWLVFLDADDRLLPQALQRIQAHIAAEPDSRMIVGGYVSQYESGRERQHIPLPLPSQHAQRVRAFLLDKSLSISNGACAMHRSLFDGNRYPECFRNVEDIPVFAHVLAHYPVSALQEPLAMIRKHPDSLRHNLRHSKDIGIHLVDEVFARLPDDCQSLRDDFYLRRCLSLFRIAYLAKDYATAWEFYKLAVMNDWWVLTRWSYTRKAIRLCMSSRSPEPLPRS